ncbi:MAG TPA: glycosyltransferase [Terriglobales bacterium]|nr:glycosyltransferase [Terriglobales bacterium]
MNFQREPIETPRLSTPSPRQPIALDAARNWAAMVSALPYQRRLAVVVITRDEARHIADCLQAICSATSSFADAQVIVVDSDSTDGTAEIAARFPVEVFRYRGPTRTAAAGRAVGTRLVRASYILFVDGDSCIEAPWLAKAIDYLDSHPEVGVVYGQRREVLEGVGDDYVSHVPESPGLGGTALYRSTALTAAGGFHPYLAAEEEGELRARIERLGYQVHETPDLMFTHRTVPKDTWQGYLHRIRRSMFAGYGQVLRASLREGLLRYHARRLNRPLLMGVYLLLGVICTAISALRSSSSPIVAWALAGLTAFGYLWYRRRHFRGALYIVCDWALSAVGIGVGMMSFLGERDEFDPIIECLRCEAETWSEGLPRWELVEWRR